MTIGAALLLLAAGAVLRFALSTSYTYGVDLHTIGDILMAVGAVGLVLWLVVWAPRARRRSPADSPADAPRDGYRDRYDDYRDGYAGRPPADAPYPRRAPLEEDRRPTEPYRPGREPY